MCWAPTVARFTSEAPTEASLIGDVPRVRALLIEAAREGHAVSYAGLLGRLGVGFTRPKMRALCRTLSRIDEEAGAAGEPDLAVLVVRASDALPGQGWWTSHAAATGYTSGWPGPAAVEEVARLQRVAFRYWQRHGSRCGRRTRTPLDCPSPRT